MINYQDILNQSLLKVFINILKEVEKKGLGDNNHLYITFETNNEKTRVPKWLQDKYPNEMTIVIQNEYYYLSVNKNDFNIGLSFNNIKTDLNISFESVISFADPSVNFGLNYPFNKLADIKNKKPVDKINKTPKKKLKKKNSSNIINFSKYKKLI
jgi:hypothetical protein